MIKVPANSQVTYLMVKWLGRGVGSISVGDGVSATRYISDTAASAGIAPLTINNTAFQPYTYSTDDTIDVTTLSDNQIVTMNRPLRAAGAAGARYSVTVEYFGTKVATSASTSVTLPVLGGAGNCTVSSSSTTYAVNDAVRGSVTILVP
jgi:hypothetical protein